MIPPLSLELGPSIFTNLTVYANWWDGTAPFPPTILEAMRWKASARLLERTAVWALRRNMDMSGMDGGGNAFIRI